MNKLRPILLVLTAVAALSVAYPARANLITNGGFETGDFTGWSTSTTGQFATASVTGMSGGISPHSGSYQAVFNVPSAAATATQTITTTPSTSYSIDFFLALARAPLGGDLHLKSVLVACRFTATSFFRDSVTQNFRLT
jgi:hypothetical protein